MLYFFWSSFLLIVAGSPFWLQFHIVPILSNLHLFLLRYLFIVIFLAKPYYAFRKVLFHSLARYEDIFYSCFDGIGYPFQTTELTYLNLPAMCDSLVLFVLFWTCGCLRPRPTIVHGVQAHCFSVYYYWLLAGRTLLVKYLWPKATTIHSPEWPTCHLGSHCVTSVHRGLFSVDLVTQQTKNTINVATDTQ